ncbi:calcineurin-like phosphoesterase superfamily domain protein [Burkholderia cepacia]|nr:calcineurin-like phosphoesterase superfamily domain protein [Burkholderia cepacia]
MRLSDRWAHDTLRADHLAWIAALPERATLDGDVLMVHGTPGSDVAYFLETVTPDGCRAATPAEIAQRAGDEPASLILCGHTHIPRTARLDDGRLIVNPGSVGLQAYADDLPHPHRIETGSPHARYAMVSRTAAGWNVEFHAVEYDWHTAAATAASRGRDDWTVALRTGRC